MTRRRKMALPQRDGAIAAWRARAQAAFAAEHNWREDPLVSEIEGARGSGRCRGRVGLADYLPGSYPACSRHGAMVAVSGELWRCLGHDCNVGAHWQPWQP